MASHRSYAFDHGAFSAKHGGGRVLNFKDHNIIYSQGDPAESLFYVLSGKVAVTRSSPEGKETIIAIIGAGEFFGESSLSTNRLWSATMVSVGDCEVVRFAAAIATRALHDDESFSRMFIAFLLERNEQMKEALVIKSFDTSEQRLAGILLVLANAKQDSHSEFAPLKIDQQTLAMMVGTTRARINLFMNKFRRLGYIDYNDHITIHNSLVTAFPHNEVSN